MSLTLITNPVTTEGGVIKNIFPGFRPVEYVFKREDLAIVSVGETSGNVEVTIATDLSSYLSEGDFIYLYAVGDSGDYEYDSIGEILSITSTTIELDIPYIENSTSGYINYLKNYYVELQLVNPDNTSIQMIPFSLKDDGDQAGNITIDVSIANDKNRKLFDISTREMTEGRIRFDVRYREISEGVTGSWTDMSDPVILVYAWEQMDTEEILNGFDMPELYKGYDFAVALSHSNRNGTDSFVVAKYNELDINRDDIVTEQSIGQLSIDLYGILLFVLDGSTTFDGDAEYIEIYGEYADLPDYDPEDYDSSDYLTT